MVNKYCSYALCKSDSRRHPDIKFVAFVKPKSDLKRAKRWIHLCGREHFDVAMITRNTYLCDKHFRPGEILNTCENLLLEPFPAVSSKPFLPRNTRNLEIEDDENDENDDDFDPSKNLADLSLKQYSREPRVKHQPFIVHAGVEVPLDPASIDISCKLLPLHSSVFFGRILSILGQVD